MWILDNDTSKKVFSILPEKDLLNSKYICKVFKKNADQLEAVMLTTKLKKVKTNIYPLLNEDLQKRVLDLEEEILVSKPHQANRFRKLLNTLLENLLLETLSMYLVIAASRVLEQMKGRQGRSGIPQLKVELQTKRSEAETLIDAIIETGVKIENRITYFSELLALLADKDPVRRKFEKLGVQAIEKENNSSQTFQPQQRKCIIM